MKKGQNFRLFIDGLCLAASKSCSIEETAELEDISTKDSTGMAKESTMKSKSWTGSADALLLNETDSTGRTLSYLLSKILSGENVTVKYTETEGTQNRTEVSQPEMVCTGQALINDLTIKATNGEEISLSIKFLGYGSLTKSIRGDQ